MTKKEVESLIDTIATTSESLDWKAVNYQYGPWITDSHKALALFRELFERIEKLEAQLDAR